MYYRSANDMHLISFALAAIFIIRLFDTSACFGTKTEQNNLYRYIW